MRHGNILITPRGLTMYKIGEFSKLSQVSVRMLRHYDKLGLLTPSEIDNWTGYRYYTIDQLPRLNRIVALNGLGLTLQQVADLMAGDDELPAERLRGMLTMRRAAIEQELMDVQMQLANVEARLRQIELEGRPSPYEFVVKSIDSMAIASVRETVPHVGEMDYYCERLYQRLYAGLARFGIQPVAPELTLYHAEEYVETDLDVETASAIDPDVLAEDLHDEHVIFRELPGVPMAASVVHTGAYREITVTVLALLAWVGQHQLAQAGPLYELHLSGRAHADGQADDPHAVVELLVPVQSPAS
ncbi:MAG: MerR family transcriptional regulator [Caldilineaceae bacterium]